MALANSCGQELLASQTHVLNHILNFINSMSIKCMVQLGIPDIIHKHGKPISLFQLVDALAINRAKSDGLRRLMRVLAHNKFFDKVKIYNDEEEEEEEAYCLTGASRLLMRGEALSMVPLALVILDPIMTDPWHLMNEWFQDECSSTFETKHGMPLWDYMVVDGRLNMLFHEGMASDADFVTTILSKESRHVFEGLKSMVDVAGGTGATTKGIAAAFTGLKCIVLDLPHVVAGLEGDESLSFVGGDMFEFIPHADAVFFKWILHDWSDEDCVKILKKSKEAITPSKNNGRKVIIVEIVTDDRNKEHEATETQLFFDMQMMIEVTGKERSEKEWATIFYAAGFTNYKITPALFNLRIQNELLLKGCF